MQQPDYLPKNTILFGNLKAGTDADEIFKDWVRDTNTSPSVSAHYRNYGWMDHASLIERAEKEESELQPGQSVSESVQDLRDIRKGLAEAVDIRVKKFEEELSGGRIVLYLYRENGKKMAAIRNSESIFAIVQLDNRTETLQHVLAQLVVKYRPCPPTTQNDL